MEEGTGGRGLCQERSQGTLTCHPATNVLLGKKITAAKARVVRVPPKRRGVRRVNVASWRLGALLLSTLTPLNWGGGWSPVLAGAVGQKSMGALCP